MKVTQALSILLVTAPAALIDNAAITAAVVDRARFNQADFLVTIGATDIGLTTLKLQESDDNATFTDVPGTLFGAAGAPALPSASDDNHLFAIHVDLLGRKRYLRLVAVGGDGSTGTFYTAHCILSEGSTTPNDAASRGFTAELFV